MSPSFPSSNADSGAQESLPQGYWVRLVDGLDRLQASVDDLVALGEAGSSQIAALVGHLTDPERDQTLEERLAALLAALAAGEEQWRAISAGMGELTEAVAKLNRSQFKSNTLAEMKDQRVATALSALQDVATRRQQSQEQRALREQDRLADLRSAERAAFAADLLPVLDGLELALDSGRTLLADRRARAEGEREPASPAFPGIPQRLAWALRGRGSPPGTALPASASPQRSDESLIQALHAWLEGLDLVRTRFLGLLATAGIYPIEAHGQMFDPREHLAMAAEARPDLPDGLVLAVARRGYRQRDRVIRYAEVTVNRAAAAGVAPVAVSDDAESPAPSSGSENSQP